MATIIGTIIAVLEFIEPSEEARPTDPPTSVQVPPPAQESTAAGDGQPREPGDSTGPAVDGDGWFQWSGLLPMGSDPCGHSGRLEAWSQTQVTTLATAPFSVEC